MENGRVWVRSVKFFTGEEGGGNGVVGEWTLIILVQPTYCLSDM